MDCVRFGLMELGGFVRHSYLDRQQRQRVMTQERANLVIFNLRNRAETTDPPADNDAGDEEVGEEESPTDDENDEGDGMHVSLNSGMEASMENMRRDQNIALSTESGNDSQQIQQAIAFELNAFAGGVLLFLRCLAEMASESLKFAWNKKSVGNTRKPVPSGGSGMTIAQEAARNVDPATGPKTAEEEEKQRKRLEAWKKMQQMDKEKGTDKDKESEIENKLNRLSSTRRDEEDDKERKMAQVRAALKEVNQRNRDLGVRKKRKRTSSSSSEVMITSTENTDVIITRADGGRRAGGSRRAGGGGAAGARAAASGTIDIDEETDAADVANAAGEADLEATTFV
eukprot:s2761_g19.t1